MPYPPASSLQSPACSLSRRDLLKAGAVLALTPPLTTLAADDPYADAVLQPGEPRELAKDAFTIIVLPDTQNYSEHHPDTYLQQTRWIVDNLQQRNIVAVLHLGDITNRSTTAEWEVAVRAMGALEGKVPYSLVPGNHDYSEGGSCQDRSTRLNEFFPIDKFRETPTFGGTYDREPDRRENSYQKLVVGDRKFLLLGLEFGPRKDVVRWANEVVSQHADHAVILTTHAYMYFDDTRYDWKKHAAQQSWNPHAYGVAKATDDDVLDGEQLWTELVSRHENFILTLNGHVLGDGLGRLTTQTPGGRDVHQLLVNFQMRPAGGDGWLRLLEFQPDGKTLHISDYSPMRKERNESPQNQFTLQLSPLPVALS